MNFRFDLFFVVLQWSLGWPRRDRRGHFRALHVESFSFDTSIEYSKVGQPWGLGYLRVLADDTALKIYPACRFRNFVVPCNFLFVIVRGVAVFLRFERFHRSQRRDLLP